MAITVSSEITQHAKCCLSKVSSRQAASTALPAQFTNQYTSMVKLWLWVNTPKKSLASRPIWPKVTSCFRRTQLISLFTITHQQAWTRMEFGLFLRHQVSIKKLSKSCLPTWAVSLSQCRIGCIRASISRRPSLNSLVGQYRLFQSARWTLQLSINALFPLSSTLDKQTLVSKLISVWIKRVFKELISTRQTTSKWIRHQKPVVTTVRFSLEWSASRKTWLVFITAINQVLVSMLLSQMGKLKRRWVPLATLIRQRGNYQA